MEKNKKHACALLLTAALGMAAMSLSFGESQARFVNRASWLTVAEPLQQKVAGDCLAEVTQPPLINLLGRLEGEKLELPITLTSDTSLSGALTWSSDDMAYINVGMRIGSRELTSGATIGVSGSSPTVVVMTIQPTELGAALTQPMEAELQVCWKDRLAGTFRVELPGSAEQLQPEETIIPAQLETSASFRWEESIPIKLTAQSFGRIRLGIQRGEGLAPFPEGTQYSLDQGDSWYRLCREDWILADSSAGVSQWLLLDLSHTQQTEVSGLTLCSQGGEPVRLQAASDPMYEMSGQVLTASTDLEIALTEAWKDCALEYSLELLTDTASGKAYVPVELSPQSLWVTVQQETAGQKLRITTGDQLPTPGTYRLTVSWSWNECSFHQEEIIFFVNYTEQTIAQKTGGAEQ